MVDASSDEDEDEDVCDADNGGGEEMLLSKESWKGVSLTMFLNTLQVSAVWAISLGEYRPRLMTRARTCVVVVGGLGEELVVIVIVCVCVYPTGHGRGRSWGKCGIVVGVFR